MSLLDPRVWLAVILGLALAYGGGRWQQSNHDKATYAAERTKAALSAAVGQVKAVDRARAEEQRRTAAQTEIANAANQEAESARADARAAGAVADQLRARVAELASRPANSSDSTIAGGGAATGGPVGVLADVLSLVDQRAGLLAAYADAARIAGQACERSYDALSVDPSK